MQEPDFSLYDWIAAPLFVLRPGADGLPRYVAYNTAALAASGLTLDRIIGRTAAEVYPGRFGETALRRHIEVMNNALPTKYELELTLNGTPRWVRTTLTPINDSDGTMIHMIGTSADITAEQESRELQTTFRTVTAEMEQFISLAAHDLRAPMRNVAFLAEMLRDGFEDQGDGKLELIDMLEEVASKSTLLIADVLNHARATNLPTEAELPFDFGLLCQNLCDVLDPQSRHDISYPPAVLQGDKTAFQIVLRNLIDNALKHGNQDRMRIRISVDTTSAGLVKITLQDNGKGFDNPGTAFLGTGTFRSDSGYGLLGIRRLIDARGGSIRADNLIPGCGSVVCFTLPAQLISIGLPVIPDTRAVQNASQAV